LADRIRAVEPTFQLTPQQGSAAAHVCQLLDGLPLAIELAAARATTMSMTEIVEHLDDPFGLLTSGPRSVPERQQTLRAAIDWSYELLTEPEHQLAATLLLEALDLVRQFGSRMRMARLFEALASLFVFWQPEACVQLAAAAEQLRLSHDAVPLPSDKARFARHLQTARQRLGQRAYGAIWAAAANVPPETTVLGARRLLEAFRAGRPPDTKRVRLGLIHYCNANERSRSSWRAVSATGDCRGAGGHGQDGRGARRPHPQ
jgi:hypothetical protein